jgi:aminoglycoside phosphotransferase (APT) family kinase protein
MAPLDGDALVHLDIRSDNVCIGGSGALVIDWNHAAIANPDLDIAAWLPSLHAEGGPLPESILAEAPSFAAWIAGFFSARAGLPDIAEAPHVRPLQLMQARTALSWAARALGLPPPEGSVHQVPHAP